uniref:Uncharacterized protein n=1 Tax=Arundo donax TaxID=35708 RepID=A0A0A9BQ36_ARUDO
MLLSLCSLRGFRDS